MLVVGFPAFGHTNSHPGHRTRTREQKIAFQGHSDQGTSPRTVAFEPWLSVATPMLEHFEVVEEGTSASTRVAKGDEPADRAVRGGCQFLCGALLVVSWIVFSLAAPRHVMWAQAAQHHKIVQTPGGAPFFRIMSFNIRRDFKSDGPNAWAFRKDYVANIFRRETPDIIGMQEVLPHQMVDLKRALRGYTVCGVGRDDGKDKGEFVPLFAKNDRFRSVRSGFFWLSKQPDVPGTIYPGAGCTRVTTWQILRPLFADVGFDVLAISTHLDHISAKARELGADVLRLRVREIVAQYGSAERGLAVVIVGDFNAEPHERALKTLLADRTRDGDPVLLDARTIAERTPGNSRKAGTFPSWNPKRNGKIIDYVLFTPSPLRCTKGPQLPADQARRLSAEERIIQRFELHEVATRNVTAARYRVVLSPTLIESKTQPSDHRPVVVDFRLRSAE